MNNCTCALTGVLRRIRVYSLFHRSIDCCYTCVAKNRFGLTLLQRRFAGAIAGNFTDADDAALVDGSLAVRADCDGLALAGGRTLRAELVLTAAAASLVLLLLMFVLLLLATPFLLDGMAVAAATAAPPCLRGDARASGFALALSPIMVTWPARRRLPNMSMPPSAPANMAAVPSANTGALPLRAIAAWMRGTTHPSAGIMTVVVGASGAGVGAGVGGGPAGGAATAAGAAATAPAGVRTKVGRRSYHCWAAWLIDGPRSRGIGGGGAGGACGAADAPAPPPPPAPHIDADATADMDAAMELLPVLLLLAAAALAVAPPGPPASPPPTSHPNISTADCGAPVGGGPAFHVWRLKTLFSLVGMMPPRSRATASSGW